MKTRVFIENYQSANGHANFAYGDVADAINVLSATDVNVTVNDITYTLPLVDFIEATETQEKWDDDWNNGIDRMGEDA